MTVPGRRETARLLLSLDPPEWFLRHVCAVADVAAWLAARSLANGRAVEVRVVEAAALLHDVDKLPRAGAPAHRRHGEGSAAWLEGLGLGALADAVRHHPVTRLADDDHVAWAATASLEARIVAYADKRAGQRLETMNERFASWRRRYPSGPGDLVARAPAVNAGPVGAGGDEPPRGTGWDDEVAARVAARARALERDVCAAAGVAPDEVRRLRWSRRALRDARRAMQG
jgi:hypothetical protein